MRFFKRASLAIVLIFFAAFSANATVASSTSRVKYTCSGGSSYAFTFGVDASSEIKVVKTVTSTGVETVMAETTDYTVAATNNDYTAGGTINTTVACATGNTLTILRNVPITQGNDFTEGMPTLYETFEDSLDKITRIHQQQQEELNRSLKNPIPSTAAVPTPVSDNYIGWNAAGTALENKILPALVSATGSDTAFYASASCPDQGAAGTACIASLLTSIGTSKQATIVLSHSGSGNTTTYTVGQNVDWSTYTNVTFKIERGAVLSHGTYTIKMPYPDAGSYQWLSGTGLVTLYNIAGYVYAEWYGAKTGDVTVDNSVPINKALLAASAYNASTNPNHPSVDYGGAVVKLGNGIYYTQAAITLPENASLEGMFVNKTGIVIKTAGISAVVVPAKTAGNPTYLTRISDLYISSYDAPNSSQLDGLYGIDVAGYNVLIERVGVNIWHGNWAILIENANVTVRDSYVSNGNYGITVDSHIVSADTSFVTLDNVHVGFNDAGGVYLNGNGVTTISKCDIGYNNNYNVKINQNSKTEISQSYLENVVYAGPYPLVEATSRNVWIVNSFLTVIENNYFNVADTSLPSEIELDAATTYMKTVIIKGNQFTGKSALLLKTNQVGDKLVFEDNETYNTAGTPGVGTYGNIMDVSTSAATYYWENGLRVSEASINIAASASAVILVAVPGADTAGTQIVGAVLRVDSALAAGETWDAAYSGGTTQSISTASAVAKNTKVNVGYDSNAASPVPTTYTNITITKNGGGSFTAQGTIRARVYFRQNNSYNDAP